MTYALAINTFEYNLLKENEYNWDYLIKQDYPTHILYCKNNNQILIAEDNICGNGILLINNLLTCLDKMNIEVILDKKIICAANDSKVDILQQIV